MWRRILTLVCTVLVMTVVHAAGQENKFIWQSESRTLEQLPKDLTTLYSTLLSAGQLPRQQYVDAEGKTIEQIMRDKKLFFGTYFPLELDQLMCALNRPVCTEASGARGKGVKQIGTSPRVVWSKQAGATVVLPAIDFQPYVAPKPYEKKQGERIEDIAVNIRQGCEAFDAECRRFIKNLNPRKPGLFEASFAGTIIVPTLALRAEITLAPPPRTRGLGPAPSENQHDEIRKSLDKNIVPQIQLKPKSAHTGEPLFDKQKPVFSLIHHPFISDTPLPSTYPVTVAVFDTWVDGTHCDFGAGTDDGIDTHNESQGESEAQATCGSAGTSNPIADHGTHVAGIIGAKLNKAGTVGINPQAKVVTYEIHPQEFANPVSGIKASDTITRALRKYTAQIFNFSFEYTGDKRTGDPIEIRITDLRNLLFVTSAGNDKANMSNQCNVRPACLSLPNVISVVALNLSADNPQLWTTTDGRSGSNYGTMFDIGAPGENVFSTIHNNRYGVLSGTSQAAPLVSGAASLLLAKDSKLMPVHLKQRLIYTSDLFEHLDDKMRGGRLNIDRALAFEDDLVTLKNGTHLQGKVDKSFIVYHKNFGATRPSAVQLGNVMRLYFNALSENYTMITLSESPEDRLTKQRNVAVLGNKVTMQTLEGGTWRSHKFDVTDIADYVSALKAP